MKKTTNIKAIVWKEGKHYVSQSLNVDVSSFGDTKKEAIENLKEALELYFEEEKSPKVAKVERPDIVPLSVRHA